MRQQLFFDQSRRSFQFEQRTLHHTYAIVHTIYCFYAHYASAGAGWEQAMVLVGWD